MRTQFLTLLVITCFTLFTGCNKDDDASNSSKPKKESLSGVWHLKNIIGGLQGLNLDYALGEVTWEFNFENNTLVIDNNIITTGPKAIYAGLDSGTYSFEIEKEERGEVLYINSIKKGVIILSGNILKIDDNLAADGLLTEFIKDGESCEFNTIISSDAYKNAPSSQLTINSLSIEKDCLKINFSSGGCDGNSWEIKLIDSEAIMESSPPQRNLRLSLKNKELCEAYITRETTVDISNLQVEGNSVVLHITNSDKSILYEY